MLGVIEFVKGGKSGTLKKAVLWEKREHVLYARIPKKFLVKRYKKRLLRTVCSTLRKEGCGYYLMIGAGELVLDGFVCADFREYLQRRLPEAADLFLKKQNILPALMSAALISKRVDRNTYDLLLMMSQYVVHLILVSNDTDKGQMLAEQLYCEYGLPIVVCSDGSLPGGCFTCTLLEHAPFVVFGVVSVSGDVKAIADGFEVQLPDTVLPSYTPDIGSLVLAGCIFHACKDWRILNCEMTGLSLGGGTYGVPANGY